MRESEHARKNPHARVIRLGIGDTTQPIPNIITSAMVEVTVVDTYTLLSKFEKTWAGWSHRN